MINWRMVPRLGIEPSSPLYERGASPQCFLGMRARDFTASFGQPDRTHMAATSAACTPLLDQRKGWLIPRPAVARTASQS